MSRPHLQPTGPPVKLSSIPHYLASPLRIWDQWHYQRFLSRNPEVPWISRGCIEYLDGVLTQDMRALEWGSGRSTRWYARRVAHILSVEHDSTWHATVTERLRALENAECRLIPLEHPVSAPTRAQYDPLPKYVAVAQSFDRESLGFVVVDGHYRQACVRAALDRLRPGGLLLIDNSNWLTPEEWGVPSTWHLRHQSGDRAAFSTVWQKPIR